MDIGYVNVCKLDVVFMTLMVDTTPKNRIPAIERHQLTRVNC